MVAKSADVIIPMRFLISIGHFLVAMLVFYQRVRPCAPVCAARALQSGGCGGR